MSHGVGPLFLTAPENSPIVEALSTTSRERPSDGGLGLGTGNSGDDGVIDIGSIRIEPSNIRTVPALSPIYWNPLDTDWAENTQTTVAVFTTPSASVGGRSLNPLSEVDEEQFVTDEGAQYLEQSGIREAAGLGPNLSWVVLPAEVASRSVTFLGNEATMRSYVGYAQSGNDIPRTLLVHLATTESGDDIAFGVSVQHRAAYTAPSSSGVDLSALVGAVSIDDLLGTEIQTPTVSGTGDVTFILEAGIAASADEAEQALGALSLS